MSSDSNNQKLLRSNSTSTDRHPLELPASPPHSPPPASHNQPGSPESPVTASRTSTPNQPAATRSPLRSSASNPNRNSVIGNFSNWIQDLNTTINALSPAHFLQNLNLNPFNRRNRSGTPTDSARNSPTASPIHSQVRRSKSEALSSVLSVSKESSFDNEQLEPSSSSPDLITDVSEVSDPLLDAGTLRGPAKLLNGTLIPTLKAKELIELAPFGAAEMEPTAECGAGHEFIPFELINPTWCDSCGEFMWTPSSLDNCVNDPLHFQSLRCQHCKYVCHARCRVLVRIDCQSLKDEQSGSHLKAEVQTEPPETPSPVQMEQTELLSKIEKFNLRLKNKGSGLGMTILDNGKFRGFIRVHLNLTRPINVVAGTRPPSIYDIIKEDDEEAQKPRRTLTSFYMPRDTVKNIHITSESTSLDVIKSMLKKFKVVDNPQKFALYQSEPPNGEKVAVLKRIADHDRPLRIALDWLDSDSKKIVLQENDTADIAWDAFALPELQNFLKILDREEKDHINQVRDRYVWFRSEMDQILKVKLVQSEGVLV